MRQQSPFKDGKTPRDFMKSAGGWGGWTSAAGKQVGGRLGAGWHVTRRWLVEQAAMPKWAPRSWRAPWMPYALAALAISLVALGETLYLRVLPLAGLQSAPLLAVLVAIALTFGMGPSLLAAALGVVWLEWAVLPPHFGWHLNNPQQFVGLGVFCLAAAGICVLAGRTQRARDRAEGLADALTVEQGRLEAILEALPESLVIIDRRGRIQRHNQAFLALGNQSVQGMQIQDTLRGYEFKGPDGEVAPLDETPLMRALRGEVVHDEEWTHVSARRGAVTILWSAAPFFDSAGRQLGAVGISHNVTELRRLERKTSESLDALLEMASGLVEQTPQVAEDVARDVAASPAARRLADVAMRMLNCTRAAVYRMDPERQVMTPVAVAGMDAAQEAGWWELRREGFALSMLPEEYHQRIEAGEISTMDVAGVAGSDFDNPLRVRVSAAAPMVVDGELVGMLSLEYADVAMAREPNEQRLMMAVAHLAAMVIERERLEREREEARAAALAATEVARRYDEFLGVASHEIKTPVTVIDANLQLLDRQLRRVERITWASDADREAMSPTLVAMRQVVDRQHRGLSRLQRLTDDLLDVSRIREGRLEMRPERCDALAIVRDRFEEQRQLHPERKLSLVIDPADLGAVMVTADGERVGQVATNYLTNAIKYSPPDGRITLTARLMEGDALCAGRAFEVSVSDEGQGISREEQALIWEAFHRAPGVKTEVGSHVGLGLGLHISKTIIERHDGAAGVESAPGHGARFWFSLPVKDEAEDEAEVEVEDEAEEERWAGEGQARA